MHFPESLAARVLHVNLVLSNSFIMRDLRQELGGDHFVIPSWLFSAV